LTSSDAVQLREASAMESSRLEDSDDSADDGDVRVTAWVSGRVQGVGFRWWTRARALELGLVGSVSNLADGRVEVIAQGQRAACEELVDLLSANPPRSPTSSGDLLGRSRPGHVRTVTTRWSAARPGFVGFIER
jgi:acylphosphatase